MSEWVQYVMLGLNILILPVMKLLWDVRSELVRLNGKILAHEQRLDRLERTQDAQQ